MSPNIIKIAEKDEDIPDGDVIATYVESLKSYLRDNPHLDDEYKRLIETLPAPKNVRSTLSIEECNILFETVDYLWEKITGKQVNKDAQQTSGQRGLLGNYWMMHNGIILHGLNHYMIIKKNTSMFATLLNINPFAIQEYLSSKPNKLIHLVLKNGGARIYATTDGDIFAQMSQSIYSKWGMRKIKGLDFKDKCVKIIDLKAPYEGWKSGIQVKL